MCMKTNNLLLIFFLIILSLNVFSHPLVGNGTVKSLPPYQMTSSFFDFFDDLVPSPVPLDSNGDYEVTFTSGTLNGSTFTITDASNNASWHYEDYFVIDGTIATTDIGTTFNVYFIDPFSGGTGTLADPYQITDCNQLQQINDYLDANFVLDNNIDCSETAYWNYDPGIPAYQGYNPNGCIASPGCGTRASGIGFTGSFDGQGYTIFNLIINRSNEICVGLFGYIENSGGASRVKNFVLKDTTVVGSNGVGAIVGTGGVENVRVFGGTVIGNDYVGCIVGVVDGNVDNAWCVGSVTGSSLVGGITGGGLYGPTNNVIFEGFVTGAFYSGGIIGKGTVNNGYAKGYVTGLIGNAGGIAGNLSEGETLSNTFFSGQVDSIGYGIVGDFSGGSYIRSYWYRTGGTATDCSVGDPAGCRIYDESYFFENNSNQPMASWDFSTPVWYITEAYPSLDFYQIPPVLNIAPCGLLNLIPLLFIGLITLLILGLGLSGNLDLKIVLTLVTTAVIGVISTMILTSFINPFC